MRYALFLLVLFLPFFAAAGPVGPPPVTSEPREEIDECIVDGLGLSFNGGITLDDVAITCCPANGFFTGRVIYCVSIAINQTAQRFLSEISDIMVPIILALMIVSLMVFGIKIMVGDSEVKEKGVLLIFKIALVFAFSYNLSGFAPQIFRMSESAVGMVTTTLDNAGSYSCPLDEIAASYVSMTNSIVWQRMDCIIDRLFGTGVNTALHDSFFAFMPALLMGGAVSPAIVMIAVAAMVGLFTYVFKAIYSYLLAYLYLGFLIAISPIVIPFIFIPKFSEAVWAWTRMVMTAIAQPMMIFAYIAITMPVIDQVVFGGGEHIKETLAEILPPEEQQAAYRQQQQFCSRQSPLNPDMYKYFDKEKGEEVNIYQNDAVLNEALDPQSTLGNFLAPMLTTNSDKCSNLALTTVDFGPQHAQKMIEIMFASVKLMLVVILLAMGMESIPMLTSSIFSSHSLGQAISRNTDTMGGMLSRDKQGKVGNAAKQTASSMVQSTGKATAAAKNQLFSLVK